MKTSLVIPTIDRLDMVKHTVGMFSFADEVVIVDNGSVDKVSEWCKEKGYVCIRFPENAYVTKAWNAGVAASSGDVVIIANNDLDRISEDFLSKLENEIAGGIWSPLMRVHGDNLRHQGNINGGCFAIKRANWRPIPESIRIWYNDNWLYDTHGVTKSEAWIEGNKSATVNSIRGLNDITDKDRQEYRKTREGNYPY